MKAAGIFVILLSQDGFKCYLETKFQTIPSQSCFRSSHMQMFFKIGVIINFIQVFPVNIAKFLRTAFLQKPSGECFFHFDKVTVQHWASYRPPLLYQKHNVGWFLLKKFVDLFRVHYIISRNHSNTFLLINLQKTKTCPK